MWLRELGPCWALWPLGGTDGGGGGNGEAPVRGARPGLGGQVTTVNTRGVTVHAERSVHTAPGCLSPRPIARPARPSRAPELEGTDSYRRDWKRLAE